MELNSLTLDQNWTESLDTESVEGRCTVQENVLTGDDLFECVPDFGTSSLDHTSCALHVVGVFLGDQLRDNEWLEQLECHRLWDTTFIE